MKIPTTLENDRLKFCKLRKGTKKPFEEDWPNKPYTYKEILEWLNKEDGNYGVLCGYGDLAVIDADNIAFQQAVENMLPETYRIKTGSGGTHNYFFIPELKQKIILELDDEKKTHLGEVQSYGQQVVAPNSIHPNGKPYEEINQIPITTISCDLLLSVLQPFMKKQFEETIDSAKFESNQQNDIDNLSVAAIWGKAGLKNRKGEYYGSHPLHGSQGGMNFWINPLKNLWHCFRCQSGGGALSAIAVKHGIIDCSEARRGNLRGDKAAQAIQIAREQYGLKDNEPQYYEEVQKTYESKPEINLIWDKNLKDYEEEEKEWIIEKLIPTKSVCILTGKRGTMKTFIALSMAYSVASGVDFLNKYSVRKGKIIYLDKENGLGIMKKRVSMIKRGMEIKEKDVLEVGFICFSQLKIDKDSDLLAIENLIKEHKPLILVIDTYRRGISFDENDAGEVSKLFVDKLRPLVEKYDLSILLIHHDRKSGERDGDEMDTMRGSSDLANYADIILRMERKTGLLILKQLKNRNAAEELPIKIHNNFTEEEVKLWFEGEFVKRSQSDRCIEDLIIWIASYPNLEFDLKETKELALSKGYNKNSLFTALNELQGRGLIQNTKKGRYLIKR